MIKKRNSRGDSLRRRRRSISKHPDLPQTIGCGIAIAHPVSENREQRNFIVASGLGLRVELFEKNDQFSAVRYAGRFDTEAWRLRPGWSDHGIGRAPGK